MPMYQITDDGEVMVEDWSGGEYRGMRPAMGQEGFTTLVKMVRDLQVDVDDLQGRLVIAAKGL